MQFVTADVVGLYPSIPHKEGLEAKVREEQGKVREEPASKISLNDFIKLTEFVLKNY